MVFNNNKTETQLGASMVLAAAVCLAATCLVTPQDAAAQGVYHSRSSVLKAFFKTSERVTFERFELGQTQRRDLGRILGYLPSSSVTVYVGMSSERIDGYAIIDNELGQHEPITYAVKVGIDGKVAQVAVMVYRESYGEEITHRRFRTQFRGKTSADPIRVGRDISAISGATISAKAMARGVKRSLILIETLILKRERARQASRSHAAQSS